jgi:hypothetical protein
MVAQTQSLCHAIPSAQICRHMVQLTIHCDLGLGWLIRWCKPEINGGFFPSHTQVALKERTQMLGVVLGPENNLLMEVKHQQHLTNVEMI